MIEDEEYPQAKVDRKKLAAKGEAKVVKPKRPLMSALTKGMSAKVRAMDSARGKEDSVWLPARDAVVDVIIELREELAQAQKDLAQAQKDLAERPTTYPDPATRDWIFLEGKHAGDVESVMDDPQKPSTKYHDTGDSDKPGEIKGTSEGLFKVLGTFKSQEWGPVIMMADHYDSGAIRVSIHTQEEGEIHELSMDPGPERYPGDPEFNKFRRDTFRMQPTMLNAETCIEANQAGILDNHRGTVFRRTANKGVTAVVTKRLQKPLA